MGSCDILLTRIFVNKIIIKSARETFMKKILLSFGCCSCNRQNISYILFYTT